MLVDRSSARSCTTLRGSSLLRLVSHFSRPLHLEQNALLTIISLLVLQDELETAMRLCGVTDLAKVRGDMSFLNTSELEQLLPKPLTRSWFAGLRSRL